MRKLLVLGGILAALFAGFLNLNMVYAEDAPTNTGDENIYGGNDTDGEGDNLGGDEGDDSDGEDSFEWQENQNNEEEEEEKEPKEEEQKEEQKEPEKQEEPKEEQKQPEIKEEIVVKNTTEVVETPVEAEGAPEAEASKDEDKKDDLLVQTMTDDSNDGEKNPQFVAFKKSEDVNFAMVKGLTIAFAAAVAAAVALGVFVAPNIDFAKEQK